MSSEWIPFTELLSTIIDNRGKTCPVGDEGIPLIATNCIDPTNLYPSYATTRYVSDETYKKWFRGHPEPGDILFVCKGSPGRTNWVPDPVDFCIAQDMVSVRADTKKIYPKYLFAALRSSVVQSQIENMHVGTMIPHFKKGDFHKLLIPVVVPNEQKKIGDIYFSMSERINLLRETNSTLEAMAQALFKSWFVDFDPVHAKQQGRAPEGMDAATAALFPDSFEESELGMVPKGWRVIVVEDFAERVGMGPFGSNIKVETFVDSGVPIISGQHLKQTLVEDNKFNFITEEHAAKLEKSCVRSGDVIFTHAGSIGQVSLLHKDAEFDRYVLSQRQFFLRCRTELMNPEWIVLYFKSPEGQHQLLANTSQVGVPSIARPVSYLRSIKLVVPPAEVNHRFSLIAASINDRVMENRKQINTLGEIRYSLLPRLISGQLRLPEAQELAQAAVAE